MDRALLVGINAYPGAPLAGCVNDVTDMAAFLTTTCGFAADSIRLLIDSRATTQAILERLYWLLDGLTPGDRILFHYSGHGTQFALRDDSGTVDRMDDAICPVDFDWAEPHMISGLQFKHIFAAVPKGVEFVWISDSCHSGELDRTLPGPGASPVLQRFLVPPADLAWRAIAAIENQIAPADFVHATDGLNLALVAACKSDQTAADARFAGRPNGALTYYLLQALDAPLSLTKPLTAVVSAVRAALKQADYAQEPQLTGAETTIGRAFLAK
jgi:metacaspase-1